MNIFFRELRANYRSFIIWSATMVILIAGGMLKYSAFAKTGQAVNDLFKQLPPALMTIMGIEPGMDLSSVGVFYSIFFLYFMLLTSVHSCLLGTTIIAKEERDKTADFLMVKPIKRHRVITAKVLAALFMVVLYNQVTFAVSAVFVAQANKTGQSLTGQIFAITNALLVIQIVFLAIGLFLGAWSHNAARASGLATLIILGTFMLKVLIDLRSNLDYLDFLTPFRYFKSFDVMFNHKVNPIYLGVSAAITALALAGTYLFFQKRDLRS
jgi:ABC-2 type transport system permease protein